MVCGLDGTTVPTLPGWNDDYPLVTVFESFFRSRLVPSPISCFSIHREPWSFWPARSLQLLGFLVLLQRDSLFVDTLSSVRPRKWHTGTILFELSKMREVTFDAFVQQTLHTPRILWNPVSGSESSGLSSTASAQANSSGASRSAQRQLSIPSPSGRSGWWERNNRDAHRFLHLLAVPAASEVEGGRRGDVNLTVRLSLWECEAGYHLSGGSCWSWDSLGWWSFFGTITVFPSKTLPPFSHPVAFSACRAGSPRAPALHQEFEVRLAKGALEITLGPSPGFPVVSSWWTWLLTAGVPWSFSLLRTSSLCLLSFWRLQSFCAVFFPERGFFSGTIRSGNRVFLDPNTSILMKAFEDPRQRERSIHSAPQVFWSVDCSPTIYQGLRSGVCMGTLSQDMPSLLPGRLALSCLLRARSLTEVQSLSSCYHTRGFVVTKEELGIVSSQTAMCFGISIDTVAHMMFRLSRGITFMSVVESFLSDLSFDGWSCHLSLLGELVLHSHLRMLPLQWHL